MSLRKKTDEVLQKGEAERGIHQPEADSVPVRAYNYWAERTSRKVPERENFCHYWRVVAFWAPLTWLTERAEGFLDTKVGKGFVLALLALALFLIASSGTGPLAILLLILISALSVFGGFATGMLIETKNFKPRYSWEEPMLTSQKEIRIAKITALVGFPGTIVVGGSYYLVKGIAALIGKIPPLSYEAKQRWNKVWMVLGGLIALALVGGIIAAIAESAGWWTIAIVAGFIASIAAIVWLAIVTEDREARRKDRETEARWAYFEEHGDFPPRNLKKPSRVSKFFQGAKDLVVFAFQVIRTKKWKICPYVEVPKSEV